MTNLRSQTLLCALASSLAACESNPLGGSAGNCAVPGYTNIGTFLPAPTRSVDLAFVLSNSPSMAAKRDKLLAQFPSLIQALADPSDRSLPSLRVAFLDGSTTGDVASGLGELRLVDGPSCGLTDPTARWLQMESLTPPNYVGDVTSDLTCMVGTFAQGSTYQQLLGSAATSASAQGPTYLSSFVRKNAYLGLILISDEDDCSTFPSSDIVAPSVGTETATLRCATRGHACSGQNLDYPTTATVTAPFAECKARTDSCTKTGPQTACSPLADVHALANRIKELKNWNAEMVTVAGIFGYPRADDVSQATYKIAPIPNPDPSGPPKVYDLWPVCYDADHPPSSPDPVTGYDSVAAGYGAKPGPRLSAFVDEFGDEGLKFSICERDWIAAMRPVGESLVEVLRSICIDAKLVDSAPNTPTLDPDCLFDLYRPKVDEVTTPRSLTCLAGLTESAEWTRTRLPHCDAATAGAPCWAITTDRTRCPVGHLVQILNTSSPYTPVGTQVSVQCRICPSPDAGIASVPGCAYALSP